MRRNIALYREGRYGPWQGEAECFFAAQQIMHATGFVGTFPFLEMGLPQVLGGAFDADAMLRAVERHKVTATVLVTPMLTRLVAAAAQNPAASASLRHVMYGGAPIDAGTLCHAMAVLGPVLAQGYGRIEGGWPLALLDVDDHRVIAAGDDALAASCGRPLADVRVKLRPVVGEAFVQAGELCVAGDAVSRAYADPDGWCSLGDIMEIDSRGYLRHRGRLDRMINTGYHIYPDEVEEVIAAIPGVSGVRVVGEARPEGGERLVAYLVPAPGAAADDLVAQVLAALAARLARYKIPRVFRAVAALP
jgi:acyl-CoA synthetase (AMP-forming)/AMP-acid ligase II